MTTSHDWVATPLSPGILRGVIELEQTARGWLPHRLPAWARARCADPQLAMAEAQPAGVRVVFRSEATAIELDVVPTRRVYVGTPPRPMGIYELRIDGRLAAQSSPQGGNILHVDMAKGTAVMEAGPVGTLRFDDLPAGGKDIEIWLPHNEAVELVALRANAEVQPLADSERKVWLHHGSSISHGSNATTPTGTWPAVAALKADVELTNLGFGGGALLDPFTARLMAGTKADLISVKLGINLVNTDVMRLRAFGPAVHGFLDTIREGHSETPLLVISPVLCPIHEAVPGPSMPEMSSGELRFAAAGNVAEVGGGKLTLQVIRGVLEVIVAQRVLSDPHIAYLDGRVLYGEADHEVLPLPDRLHPDAATHRLMGERFAGTGWLGGGALG